jgi:hypothetical protein
MIKTIFLLIILLTETCQSLLPTERYALSSVLVDKKLFFFGGKSPRNPKSFDQILFLDVSKPFNISKSTI